MTVIIIQRSCFCVWAESNIIVLYYKTQFYNIDKIINAVESIL
ncbi:hypothetical protein B4119_1622 [Parageobacillus caldoxylosilyticus]|uniref:Uncharacterized protein n=1 Tax=Saccharococcus caldoxylosilyticus TaxID=81408 RepID=A0A150LP68_9BACL|nr:hypothetical protein B4119_1622 [Parageobacillus caldoxylosilyticus]